MKRRKGMRRVAGLVHTRRTERLIKGEKIRGRSNEKI